MNYSEVFARAGQLVLRQRMLWGLGFLASLGGIAVDIVLRTLLWPEIEAVLLNPSVNVTGGIGRILQPAPLAVGTALLSLLGLAAWFVSVSAEGGLIRSTMTLEAGGTVSFGEAWRTGRRLLGRFVAIDTILFLPLFLLAMALTLLSSGGLVGLAVVATRPGADLPDLLLVLGLTALVALPLLCLMVPVGVATILLRLLAFRGTALEGLSTRLSIHRAWTILRARLVAIILLGLLLWAVRYLASLPTTLLTVGLSSVGVASFFLPNSSGMLSSQGASLTIALLSLGVALLIGLVSAVIRAFTSAAWTLAYLEWINDQS